MKSMKALLTISICLLVSLLSGFSNIASASNSAAYTEQFQLEQSTARYYVATLHENDTWVLSCAAVYKGVFHLFIFDERPKADFFNEDGQLDDEITKVAVAYNNTPIEIFSITLNDTISFISLEFKASKSMMYYLEIACVQSGPDTFMLNSSHEIQPYFIPFIPGFPVDITLYFSLFTVCVIIVIRKNKQKKN